MMGKKGGGFYKKKGGVVIGNLYLFMYNVLLSTPSIT